MSHAELIERYEKGSDVFEEALRGVPTDLLDRAPAPGKWTIRQIAVHLADADLVAATRMRFVAAEPGAPLPAFDQDKWAASLGYPQQTPEQAIAVMRVIRKATAAMLRSLPESSWGNTGNHSERGKVTLLSLVEDYTQHATHHAGQVRALCAQLRK